MKILMVNLSDQPIPPPANVIRADLSISVALAQEMQKRGHTVYFLCPKDSTIDVNKIFTATGSLSSVISVEEFNTIDNYQLRTELLLTFYTDLYFKLTEAVTEYNIDLIHFHTNSPLSELVALSRIKTPCVFTLHNIARSSEYESRVFNTFNNRKNNFYVSISNYQERTFPKIPFMRRVQHGLNLSEFPFHESGAENLLFGGRLKKNKGALEAISIALNTNHKLVITGAVSYTDQDFFKNELLPLINQNTNSIVYNSLTPRSEMYKFYSGGKVLLVPILWEEPFGLVMIETLACGTPAIAYARGAAPEIIVDGKTGFLINPSDNDIRGDYVIKKTGIAGFYEAINRIYGMQHNDYLNMRKQCREHVEHNFTFERMANEYESIYNKIIALENK